MSVMFKAKKQFAAPRIKAVEPGDGDFVLNVTWVNGKITRVDLTEPVFRLRYLQPLRDKNVFRALEVADWGTAIAWSDELDYSAERLWELAHDQANAEMCPSDFRKWLKTNNLTQQMAADLLGISKRSVAYYSTGAQPVTRLIRLALLGAELELVSKKDETKRRRIHVVPSENTGWVIVRENDTGASSKFKTKKEAVNQAKKIVRNSGGQFVVYQKYRAARGEMTVKTTPLAATKSRTRRKLILKSTKKQ